MSFQPAILLSRAASIISCGHQEKDGSWLGRWGMNYIYGTWSVLCAFHVLRRDLRSADIQKAIAWLKRIQNKDGGWGEGGESYNLDYTGYRPAPSTPSQTAWALLALMAVGRVEDDAVTLGVRYLAATQAEDGFWPEERFTATGFPRVFYLRYHGYESHNATALRRQLSWLNPITLGLRTSAGFGDRLGIATPGHLRALREAGGHIAPIPAQQSIREMTRTGRSPQQVFDDATWGGLCRGLAFWLCR